MHTTANSNLATGVISQLSVERGYYLPPLQTGHSRNSKGCHGHYYKDYGLYFYGIGKVCDLLG